MCEKSEKKQNKENHKKKESAFLLLLAWMLLSRNFQINGNTDIMY